MDSATLLLIVAGACAAGFVQGLSGFAFAMTAMAFWAWGVDPQLAAVLVVFCSLIGQVLTLASARRGFNLKRTLPFIVGGALGVPVGAWVLPHIDQLMFRAVIGGFLAVWCPLMLVAGGRARVRVESRAADGGFGFVGGVMGGLGGLSGAAPTLWCTLRNWDKDAQRAVIQWFNLAMHCMTLTAYAAGGLITAERVRWFLVAVPAMLVPTLLGAKLYARISDAAFRRLVLALLSASGIALLASSVPRLLMS